MSVRKTYCRLFRSIKYKFLDIIFAVLPIAAISLCFIDPILDEPGGILGYIAICSMGLTIISIVYMFLYIEVREENGYKNKWLEYIGSKNYLWFSFTWGWTVYRLVVIVIYMIFDHLGVDCIEAIIPFLIDIGMMLMWIPESLLFKNGVFEFVIAFAVSISVIYVVCNEIFKKYCKKDAGEEL